MFLSRSAQASNNVLAVYKQAIKDLDMSVYNAIYEEMDKTGATEFGNGWVAATLWMNEYFGLLHMDQSWIDDNLAAKKKEIEKRFPLIKEK